MEEWLGQRNVLDEAVRAAEYARGVSLTYLLGVVSETAEHDRDARRAYATLFHHARNLYYAVPGERTAAVVRAMHALEDGLGEMPTLTPDLERDEMMRRLAELDAGRARFKQRLLDTFATMRAFADRNYVIVWARLVYYHVHGFQAPPTRDAERAARDAAGETDHALELIQEVIDASPEAQVVM